MQQNGAEKKYLIAVYRLYFNSIFHLFFVISGKGSGGRIAIIIIFSHIPQKKKRANCDNRSVIFSFSLVD